MRPRQIKLAAAWMLAAALFQQSGRVHSESLDPEFFTAVQIGPTRELVVAGNMGAMLSMDWGESWTPVSRQAAGSYSGPREWNPIGHISEEYLLSWTRPLRPAPQGVDRKGRHYRCNADASGVEIREARGEEWLPAASIAAAGEPKPGLCLDILVVKGIPNVLTPSAVLQGLDGRKRWQSRPLGQERVVYSGSRLLADDRGQLYIKAVPAMLEGSILSSRDQGATWEEARFGRDGEAPGLLRIQRNTLYFWTASPGEEGRVQLKLYQSHDGVSSELLLEGIERPSIVWTEFSPDILDIGPQGELAIVADRVLYLSTNQGESWERVSYSEMQRGRRRVTEPQSEPQE